MSGDELSHWQHELILPGTMVFWCEPYRPRARLRVRSAPVEFCGDVVKVVGSAASLYRSDCYPTEKDLVLFEYLRAKWAVRAAEKRLEQVLSHVMLGSKR